MHLSLLASGHVV